MLQAFLSVSALALVAAPALAGVTITYENPGLYTSTATFDWIGVETFDARATGANRSFMTDFNTAMQPFQVTAQYAGVDIRNANQFGGARNSRFAETFTTTGYTVSLGTNDPRGINYFGFWLSALDRGNRLEFLSGGDVIFSFTPAAVIARLGACPDAGNAYCGNPNDNPRFRVLNEQFAFVNFFFTDGQTIDAVRFFQIPGGGYESDNHSVGYFLEKSGNPIPEPATWALMIAGFGLVGASLRRRQVRAIA